MAKSLLRCVMLMLSLTIVIFYGYIVSGEEAAMVESIVVSVTNTTMQVGQIQNIKVACIPANADAPELVYTSSNPQVAIAAVGKVIANVVGTADITVTVKDTGLSASVRIEVTEKPDIVPADRIEVSNSSLSVETYEYRTIGCTVYPEDATDKTVIYQSLDESIATVSSSGRIYGRRIGTTSIEIQSTDGNAVAYVRVTVYSTDSDEYEDNEIPVDRVEIWYDSEVAEDALKLMQTESIKLEPVIYPETATNTEAIWESDDENIAEVEPDGTITAKTPGETKIWVITKDGNKSASVDIQITELIRYPNSIKIEVAGTPSYTAGSTIKLNAVFTPEDTTVRNTTWNVTPADLAVIDNEGNLTLKHKGSITVKVWDKDYQHSDELKLDIIYAEDHFTQIKEDYGVKSSRTIILDFDAEVNIQSALQNIFASADKTGNGENEDIVITASGSRVTVAPKNIWQAGENYIFIKSGLMDIYGNMLNENLKYKFNVRGAL